MTTAPSQAFTKKSLKLTRRWKSQGHLTPHQSMYPTSEEEWNTLLANIINDIAADKFTFEGMHTARIKGKTTLTTKYLEEALILRKLNDNIRRAYGIRQPNRQSLIKTARQAARENTPKSIVRIDIKKCFESIPRDWLIRRLEQDGFVSHESISLIRRLFNYAGTLSPKLDAKGLPRGVIISTSLAELKLRQIDEVIRRIDGVYLVLRYVDDILVFSTKNAEYTNRMVEAAVHREGLQSSPSKHNQVDVACTCANACTHGHNCPCKKSCTCATTHPNAWKEFEYLGYKFILRPHNNKNADNEVYCLISDRKIERIKTRIHLAIKSHQRNANLNLLYKRIDYLTSNQAIYVTPGKRSLFNGLSHSHSEYSEPTDDKLFMGNRIAALDDFYQSNIRKRLDASAWPNLRKLSFKSGFTKKRRTKYSNQEVLKIKECWENA
jgi:hypothetical protein